MTDNFTSNDRSQASTSSDVVGRIEVKIDAVIDQQHAVIARQDKHEAKLESLQQVVWKLVGGILGTTTFASVATATVIALLKK